MKPNAQTADILATASATVNVTDARWIIRHASRLCDLALPHLGASGEMQTWCGKYGQVIVGDDGQHWIGDLCYMHEKFGWSHSDYMTAYGYTGNGQECLTDGLKVHTFQDKHILVIRTGSDGAGPLGLGLDTAAVSFVSTDRARVEAAAACCIAWLETKRADFAATLQEEADHRAAWVAKAAAKAAQEKHLTTPGHTITGTRKVADYQGGGYRGRPRFKSREETVTFTLRSASADYFTATTGTRYKRSTFTEVQAFTPRQIAAQKAAATRRQNRQLITA
jgi:hypothetical protein